MACMKMNDGTVIEKRYSSAYYVELHNGKDSIIKIFVPEKWMISICVSVDNKGNRIEKDVYVNERVYDSIKIDMQVNTDSLQK